MAMTLRLTQEETEALRARAEAEGRSMQDIARQAVVEYVTQRPARLRAAIERIRAEDAELLERLGQ
jgi:predicted transcriptional regulator